MDKLKDNKCSLDFICLDEKNCVLNPSEDSKTRCPYVKEYIIAKKHVPFCYSSVARVNTMVIEIQKLTGKKVVLK